MNHRQGTSRMFLLMLFASTLIAGSAFAGIDQGAVDKCKSCHEDVVNKFMAGAHHGKAWTKGDPAVKYSCESCHGPGDKHVGNPSKETIITFGKKSVQTAEEQSKQCLSCHGKSKDLNFWSSGKHKRNDVSCASCHNAHGQEKAAKSPETCYSCHKDIKSQVNRLSHHPIMEGKVSCSDCHNPHGSLSHGMLRAENANNLCYKCHADKRGPFMFEHAPVEENCMTCHNAHGSRHAKLLTEKQPNLCQDCHTVGRHPTTIYDGLTAIQGTRPGNGAGFNTSTSNKFFARSCTNCHTMIHGSNGPANPEHGYNSGQFLLR